MTMNLANMPQIPHNYGGPTSSHYITHHIHSHSRSHSHSHSPSAVMMDGGITTSNGVQQQQTAGSGSQSVSGSRGSRSSQSPAGVIAISSSSQSGTRSTTQSSSSPRQAQQRNGSRSSSASQPFVSWNQYPTSLGTAIGDPAQRNATYAAPSSSATHSTPNSYTAEYYGDEHQQSLGFGAMSVTSSIINQPHTLQAANTIQSALNNLNNSSLLPINTTSSIQSAIQRSQTNGQQQPLSIKEVTINNTDGVQNKMNLSLEEAESSSTAATSSNVVVVGHNTALKTDNNTSSFYLAPGSANHGGSYRQTLNPAIYNAYRMSAHSNSVNARNGTSLGSDLVTVGGPRTNTKSPVIHVIAETVYRVPSSAAGAAGRGGNGGAAGFRKQDRFDKTALYKTELCTNWMLTGSCTYGNKCHFAHGVEDLKPRMRVENYKTQPCCDPARDGCKRCMYGRRCNYCHPGEAIRRPHPTPYYDKDYYHALHRDFGQDNNFPFGIYV